MASCTSPFALHPDTPARGRRGIVHGRPVRFALPDGNLRGSGHRGGTSADQPLRAVGAGRPGAGNRQHSLFPRLDGLEWASARGLRGGALGFGLRRCTTGFCLDVPAAAAGTGLRGVRHDERCD